MIQGKFETFEEITLLLEKKGIDDVRKLIASYAAFFMIACLMAKMEQSMFDKLTQEMRNSYPQGMKFFSDK